MKTLPAAGTACAGPCVCPGCAGGAVEGGELFYGGGEMGLSSELMYLLFLVAGKDLNRELLYVKARDRLPANARYNSPQLWLFLLKA